MTAHVRRVTNALSFRSRILEYLLHFNKQRQIRTLNKTVIYDSVIFDGLFIQR
jgi:hypothetical protein